MLHPEVKLIQGDSKPNDNQPINPSNKLTSSPLFLTLRSHTARNVILLNYQLLRGACFV